jgi:hypothetical protein
MKRKRWMFLPIGVAVAVGTLLPRRDVTVIERHHPFPGGNATGDLLELRVGSGFRAFNRGFRTDSEATFPRLPETNAFWATVNRHVREQTRESIRNFSDQPSWREFWSSVKEPSAMNAWEMKAQWDAEFVSPQLVSLIASYWEYTGGAHGNTGFGALNVVPDGPSFRELKLAEFFGPDTNWPAVIAAKLEQQINQRKRENWGDNFSEDLAAKVVPGEIADAVFTITPGGFKFWFAPYEKGAYAEGVFEPLIPYSELVSLLGTNEPARWLPCFPNLQ